MPVDLYGHLSETFCHNKSSQYAYISDLIKIWTSKLRQNLINSDIHSKFLSIICLLEIHFATKNFKMLILWLCTTHIVSRHFWHDSVPFLWVRSHASSNTIYKALGKLLTLYILHFVLYCTIHLSHTRPWLILLVISCDNKWRFISYLLSLAEFIETLWNYTVLVNTHHTESLWMIEITPLKIQQKHSWGRAWCA